MARVVQCNIKKHSAKGAFYHFGDLMFVKVEKYCQKHCLFAKGSNILIACSGGPDSVALVLFFLSIQEKWQLKLSVAHFEHGIRGEASLADADFVREFCKQKKLRYYQKSVDVPGFAAQEKLSVEMAARKLRYDFLKQTADNLGGALIAVAHHADDQAETVLMRLLRGSGISGLAAMRPKNGLIIRPFLCVNKDELTACCAAAGVVPRHDATNDCDMYLRNRLRHKLMPLLKQEYNPDIELALCRLAEIASAQDDFLHLEAQKVFDRIVTINGSQRIIDRQAANELPTALLRELLREVLKPLLPQGTAIDFEQTEKLGSFLCEGGSGSCLELSFGVKAEIVYDKLILTAGSKTEEFQLPCRKLSVPGQTAIPELGLTVEAEIISEKPQLAGNNWAVFDFDKISGPFFLRGRKNGDRIDVSGGSKKVKEILINRKIPRDMRNRMPVICTADKILWLGGLRRAATCGIDENTKKFLLFKLLTDRK